MSLKFKKNLDLHGAKAIRQFGIDKFNEECRKIVLRYTKEWERFVERSGRWVDFDRQYRTMDLDYMESIWWVFKSLWDRGLIHQSFKCVAYSWAINTPLSNFEVNLNYKTVQDPAITIRARMYPETRERLGIPNLPDLPINAYVWTTTPWTLPSNMALGVGREIDYSVVVVPGKEIVLIASQCLAEFFPELAQRNGEGEPKKKKEKDEHKDPAEAPRLAGEVTGSTLLGLQYTPFFPYFEAERERNAFRVYHGDFVTAEDGTGIVHQASFGEDDLGLFLANNITIVDPVDEDGNFDSSVPDYAGMFVKDADPQDYCRS